MMGKSKFDAKGANMMGKLNAQMEKGGHYAV